MPSTSVRPGAALSGIEVEQGPEMGIFAAGAAEIVPGCPRHALDLGLGLLRDRRRGYWRSAVLWAGSRGPIERASAAPDRARALGPEGPRQGEDAAHDPDHDRLGQAREEAAGALGGMPRCVLA